MAHGVGDTDRLKVSDITGKPVETSGEAGRITLSTRDRIMTEALLQIVTRLGEIYELLLAAVNQ